MAEKRPKFRVGQVVFDRRTNLRAHYKYARVETVHNFGLIIGGGWKCRLTVVVAYECFLINNGSTISNRCWLEANNEKDEFYFGRCSSRTG